MVQCTYQDDPDIADNVHHTEEPPLVEASASPTRATKHIMMDARDNNNSEIMHSEIVQFYAGKNIFFTGASGYVGTLLVEKILRTCKHVNTLFLLFRAKQGQDINTRVKEYFNEEVFARMKLENPNYYKQVRIIPGDLCRDKFDLSEEDEELLIQETHVIFHVAATVRFDEHIRVANQINVKGTQSVLDLAKQMPHLQSFVYVSTAYCNSDLPHIEEKVNPPLYTQSELTQLLDSCSDEEAALLTTHVLGNKPNTYTLTKSTAEHLIEQNKATLPISIIRPSVIVPTLTEPFPLYYKGLNLFLALFFGVGMGVIRVTNTDPAIHLDTVPGDRTINAILAVGWYTSQGRPQHHYVFNYTSRNDNPIRLWTAGKFPLAALRLWKESSPLAVWNSHLISMTNPALHYIFFIVLHILPCLVFVPLEKCFQKEERLLKIYRKIWFLRDASAYFTTNEWTFTNDNTKCVLAKLSAVDKQMFDFDLGNFHWRQIYLFIPRSVSKYTLKDQVTKEKYHKKMVYIAAFEKGVMWAVGIGLAYGLCNILAGLLNRHL